MKLHIHNIYIYSNNDNNSSNNYIIMIVIAIIIVVVIIVIVIDHKGNQAGKSLSLNVPAMPPKNRPGTN